MLPPFIIEQIRQREEEERRQEQPGLRLPLPEVGSRPEHLQIEQEPERGVFIIDLMTKSSRSE